uniref:Uncharacterized protein n=1 Tax=Nelumbo nucifera TaxID=4432 RepID=A0A822XYA9_NELNU|nr:TPA_asm: hypothetical protein HUJ06_025562 [Nelumbo nucifera]
MSRFGCNLDVVTYYTLVHGVCRAGNVKIGHNLLKGLHMKNSDLNPDIVTDTTLIRGYFEKREIAQALNVSKEMLGCRMKPNRSTYDTLIQGLYEAI